MESVANRRPLKSRATPWAAWITRQVLRTPLTPNAVSMLGIGFAAAGAGAFLLAGAGSRWWWLAGAAAVQLRLLANLLDGLVAVEGGRHSPTGALWNEFPDRIEDSLLLVAAGYAAGQPALGWMAALMAMATAYVRALGGGLGLGQDFSGPLAKPQRMALLTGGAIAAPVLPALPVIPATLALIAAGAALTAMRRLQRQANALREQGR
ncbi:MAG: CDP-alcohol phosphatidyltransferase family protein [Novosphingobium sp.]|nr:CDP-alcohol phosphatidyltransferase family protein [Novosphingobium sp.]